jgi:peroxiredoxin
VNDSVAPEFRGAPFSTILAALVCMLCVVCGAPADAFAGSPATELQRWAGDTPPSFTLPDTASSDLSLAGARGQVVLVHFFATWCEPCREELPALSRLAARGQGNVKVLAISVAEGDLRVRGFLETMPLDFPVLLDRDRAVAKGWNVSTLPTTFVLDANLRPQFVVEADFAWDGIDPAKLAGMMPASTKVPASLSNDITLKSTPRGG